MLRSKNLTYLALALITASSSLFFYCNSSRDHKQNSVAEDYNPYFPIAEGQTWDYINQAPRDETELYSAGISDVSSGKESVSAEFKSFPFFTKSNIGCTVRITRDGSVFVKDSTEQEKLLLPSLSKLQKGYSWLYGNWAAGIFDTNVTVQTENGEFKDCIYAGYSLGGITFSVELWFAKDKGVVKWGANRTNPPQRFYTYYVLK